MESHKPNVPKAEQDGVKQKSLMQQYQTQPGTLILPSKHSSQAGAQAKEILAHRQLHRTADTAKVYYLFLFCYYFVVVVLFCCCFYLLYLISSPSAVPKYLLLPPVVSILNRTV